MSGSLIHPTAIISPGAQIDEEVRVGPFCCIGSHVKIGRGTTLQSHVVFSGHLEIGEKNIFFPFCSIGAPPQDLTYQNEPTKVVIGDRNTFREYVSIHRGTTKEKGITQIGNGSFLMANVHIGHDCIVEDECIMANGVMLGGHVRIGAKTFIGGQSCVQQLCKVGSGAYIGGGTIVIRDIPSFCTVYGNRAKIKGINIIGLKRNGYTKDEILKAVDFFRALDTSELSPYDFVQKKGSDIEKNEIIKTICTQISLAKKGITPLWSQGEKS